MTDSSSVVENFIIMVLIKMILSGWNSKKKVHPIENGIFGQMSRSLWVDKPWLGKYSVMDRWWRGGLLLHSIPDKEFTAWDPHHWLPGYTHLHLSLPLPHKPSRGTKNLSRKTLPRLLIRRFSQTQTNRVGRTVLIDDETLVFWRRRTPDING